MRPASASSASSAAAPGGTSRGTPPARTTERTYAIGTSAASRSQTPKAARVRYVVIPTTGLEPLPTLVQPLALPRGHDPVEDPLLGMGVIEVVVDDFLAERRPGHRAVIERRDRL